MSSSQAWLVGTRALKIMHEHCLGCRLGVRGHHVGHRCRAPGRAAVLGWPGPPGSAASVAVSRCPLAALRCSAAPPRCARRGQLDVASMPWPSAAVGQPTAARARQSLTARARPGCFLCARRPDRVGPTQPTRR
jgi:hypothetical protein